MDKAKEIWGFVKRQHFWILSPILFIIGLVGWFMATGKLAKSFDENKGKVDSYISTMSGVRGISPHPNQEYLDNMAKLIEQRRENVRKAWEKKWENQKQRLVWPEALNKELRDVVDGMRPIESVGKEKDNALRPIERGWYVDFVKQELPRLAKTIGSNWEPAAVAGASFSASGFGGGGTRSSEPRGGEPRGGQSYGEEVDESQVVAWNPVNQGEFAARLIAPYDVNPPRVREILYTQEELWVLGSIIDVIKKTNGDVMARSQAAIKEIRHIKIGGDVKPPREQGFNVVRPAALVGEEGASPDGAAPEAAAEPTGGDKGAEPAPGAVSPEGVPLAPIDPVELMVKNRYYDENYEPIPDLATLKLTGMVAKRIPVRLMVLMDQRKMNKLLVEAANAPLTFEVRQLRFNPSSDATSGPSGVLGGGRASEMSFASPAMRSKVRDLKDYQTYDRWVELFGIIYIFNPVNDALLTGEQALGSGEAAPAG